MSDTAKTEESFKAELFKAALAVRNNSHSPYSGYKVASALRMASGKVFAGVNIENASYGATICAERSAVFTAVTAGEKNIEAVLILTDEEKPWPPCGMCRQVLAEFASPQTKVYLANLKGIQKELTLSELFPYGFSTEHLN